MKKQMNNREYQMPQIKVCDYLSKNELMIGIGDGSTPENLGKENDRSFEEYEEAAQPDIRRSVWDD